MNTAARLRNELRPHGRIAAGCRDCLYLSDCGGFEPELTLFNSDCIQANCCRSHLTGDNATWPPCDNVCPNNPAFLEQLREVGGLSLNDISGVTQTVVELPLYIPLIYRRYIQRVSITWPMVALSTYEVVKVTNGQMNAVASCPESLRTTFGLSAGCSILLRGVADDRPLERYWSYRRANDIPKQLATLGVTMAVGPNFSHFLDVPRHDNLFNRKRQILCVREFVDAGLNTVPHLNAAQPGDWRFWSRFLEGNPTIKVIAVEFETGNRSRIEGERVVRELAKLQQLVGRPLHPLVIGGTQYLERVAAEFSCASFVDSTPFMKAVHRQSFLNQAAQRAVWRRTPTDPGKGVDELLHHNLHCYSTFLNQRWVSPTRHR